MTQFEVEGIISNDAGKAVVYCTFGTFTFSRSFDSYRDAYKAVSEIQCFNLIFKDFILEDD